MGYRHSRDDLLAAACDVALDKGVSSLTFAAVGARANVSDRTVVYYFPTKTDLILNVTAALGVQLQALLDDAFGAQPLAPTELMTRAWPALTTDHADRVFALVFEIIGLASAGREPFRDIASRLVDDWADWLTPRTLGSTLAIRRRRALATLAQLDGLLLLRRIAGPAASDDAARELGIHLG